ncbi:hypothetical protein HMPREF1599_04119 [Escherichia coli 907713]|nr:hypothetical protein HMPREF1599_04119 [Escherichia coli 907713]
MRVASFHCYPSEVRFLPFSHSKNMNCLISRIFAHNSKVKRDFMRHSEHLTHRI